MIRFLQKDNRVVKIIFIVIIAVASITMVIALVPGIFSGEETTSDTYATVHSPGFLGRVFGSTSDITQPEVQQIAQRILEQQHLPDMVLPYVMPRAGQALIQREVLLQEANRLGLQVSDADLRHALQTGPFAEALFPNGQFIGADRYADFVDSYFHMSTQDFERQVKKEVEISRLETSVTAGITVSDQQVRDAYLQQGVKVKFDYAVIDSDNLLKQINPTDTELRAFFKENSARYATADPETRKIAYIAFNRSQLPDSAPQVTDQAIAQYYQQNQKTYQVPEEVKVRHILVKVAAEADGKTDPKADAAARQKADGILKQLKAGANFADLAKKDSDDPGSKAQGGELGFIQRGATVPAFEAAAFALQPGQLSGVIKTQFGYHIILCEAKDTAHTKPLEEVKSQILATLTREKESEQEAAFARQLVSQAAKSSLASAAAAHHLQVVTTDYVQQGATIPGLADSSKLLAAAFSAKPGSAPQSASTGDGYAVFQVAGINAAHAPTFDEYKTHLLDDFRQQQLPLLLAKKTNELADKAKAENSLDQAAKELGVPIKTSDLVGRTTQVPDIGDLSTAAPEIFNLNVGQISKAINTGRTGIVVKIDQKQEPSEADIAKNLDTTRDQLLSQQREQLFEVFVTDLVSRYEKQGLIRINKHAQMPQQLPS